MSNILVSLLSQLLNFLTNNQIRASQLVGRNIYTHNYSHSYTLVHTHTEEYSHFHNRKLNVACGGAFLLIGQLEQCGLCCHRDSSKESKWDWFELLSQVWLTKDQATLHLEWLWSTGVMSLGHNLCMLGKSGPWSFPCVRNLSQANKSDSPCIFSDQGFQSLTTNAALCMREICRTSPRKSFS